MFRRSWSATLFGILVATAFTLPAGSAQAEPVAAHATSSRASLSTSQFESRLLALTNARRKKVGCKALKTNTALTKAARTHTKLMAAAGNLSHQLPNESGLAARIVKAGYKKWTGLAENIAWGPTTPAGVFNLWMGSADHKANIQHCGYHDAGFALVVRNSRTWVTLDLGSHR